MFSKRLFSGIGALVVSGAFLAGCSTVGSKDNSHNLSFNLTSKIEEGEKLTSYGTTFIDSGGDKINLINVHMGFQIGALKTRQIEEIYLFDPEKKIKSQYPLIVSSTIISEGIEENGTTTRNYFKTITYDCGTEKVKSRDNLPPLVDFKPDGKPDLTIVNFSSQTVKEPPQIQELDPYMEQISDEFGKSRIARYNFNQLFLILWSSFTNS
jgi:hypothetical protein